MENIKISKRDNYKLIEIGERTFKITKFDARRGSFILFKVLGVITPMIDTLKKSYKGSIKEVKAVTDVNLEDLNFTELATGLMDMSEEDFAYIQDSCLKVCYEVLGSGDAPVLNQNGTYGVIGLEQDIKTIMTLTIHTIVFNVSGFFGGNLLDLINKQEG